MTFLKNPCYEAEKNYWNIQRLNFGQDKCSFIVVLSPFLKISPINKSFCSLQPTGPNEMRKTYIN
jgi:hypothetical protein